MRKVGFSALVPACERQVVLPTFRSEYSDLLQGEEGQSTLTETSARQTCLSHAGTREPNLSHDCASGEALALLEYIL